MDLDKAMTTRERLVLIMFAALCVCALVGAWAVAHAQTMAGPAIHTNADVPCPSGSSTPLIAAATPAPAGYAGVSNRMCIDVEWVSGSPARIGDANISASRGIPIAAATGAAKTICADSAILCWGVGGPSTLSVTELGRQ